MDGQGPRGQPLRTWIVDALLVGVLVGGLLSPTVGGTVSALDPHSSMDLEPMVELELASLVAAPVVCAALAVPAALVTRVAWRVGRPATFLVGPAMGAVAALALFVALQLLMSPYRVVETRAMPWVGLAGAAGVGPPWVAYVAVLARGRSGRGVALATPVWAMGAVALAIFFLWVRWKLGYQR